MCARRSVCEEEGAHPESTQLFFHIRPLDPVDRPTAVDEVSRWRWKSKRKSEEGRYDCYEVCGAPVRHRLTNGCGNVSYVKALSRGSIQYTIAITFTPLPGAADPSSGARATHPAVVPAAAARAPRPRAPPRRAVPHLTRHVPRPLLFILPHRAAWPGPLALRGACMVRVALRWPLRLPPPHRASRRGVTYDLPVTRRRAPHAQRRPSHVTSHGDHRHLTLCTLFTRGMSYD